MKKIFFYSIALLMGAMGLISCDNDFELPPMVVPEAPAGMEANISIADLKEAYWKDDRNYCDEIGKNEETGEDYIIEGRVVSSDASGNIYKNFIIEDESGALTISVNMKDIYKSYKFGQKVLVRATGMHIGKYNGLQQLGAPEWYAAGNTYETTFMEEGVLTAHAFQNGLPDPAKVDTAMVTIPELQTIKNNHAELLRWTSRLIRVNNVRWEDAGKEFAGSANANRNLIDENGNRLLVRNSAYSDFSYDILPSGYGDVVGILSFYGTDFQMVLIDANGLIGFDGTTTPDKPEQPDQPDQPVEGQGDGTVESPFLVSQVIGGTAVGNEVWVEGYIVGWVDGQVYTSGANFNANATSQTNLMLAASADETDASKCIPVQLPSGDVRTALNLQTNPGNYKKVVKLKGNIEKYFGITGVKTVTEYVLDGEAPAPVEGVQFKKVTTVTSGKQYLIVAGTQVAQPIAADKNYGWLYVSAATPENDIITVSDAKSFVITATDKGYTIQQSSDNRYLYQEGTFNSFQIGATVSDSDAAWWDITPNADGTFTILNKGMNKWIQYSPNYTSFGSYDTLQEGAVLPSLYEKL
ncbi:MAG: hypothetical protein HDS58_02075 [Barnesiella sp.]|nr:hypothetical protein [Barnesiella sp.]